MVTDKSICIGVDIDSPDSWGSLSFLPGSWSGYAQHSYDCQPMPTKYLTAAQCLRFRDNAMTTYLTSPSYRQHIKQTYGTKALNEVEYMSKIKLRRKLLEPVSMEDKIAQRLVEKPDIVTELSSRLESDDIVQ